MSPDATGDVLGLYVACAYLVVLALFALPSIIAFRRHDPNRWVILAFNASAVGWVVALALAVYPMIHWGPSGSTAAGAKGQSPNDAGGGQLSRTQAALQARTAGVRLSAAAAVAEIERLGRLRQDGHLSEVEFAALKAKVLERF